MYEVRTHSPDDCVSGQAWPLSFVKRGGIEKSKKIDAPCSQFATANPDLRFLQFITACPP